MAILLIIVCLVLLTQEISSTEYRLTGEGGTLCDLYDGDSEEHCVEGGYERWMCYNFDPWKDDHYWVYEGKTECPDSRPLCKCHRTDDWNLQRCKCVSPAPTPELVPTGVIRWNGTLYYDDHWWVRKENPRTVVISGEIHKDSKGRFLYVNTKVGTWEYQTQKIPELNKEYEILIPNENGTGFLKVGILQCI